MAVCPRDFTEDSSRAPLGGYEDLLRPEIVDPRANVPSHFLNGLRIHMPGWIDTRTVLMDGSLHPLGPALTAGS